MGEVYRARDTRLNRDVALKFLRSDVASDPERLARFRREAQVLASLNHPNIAQIHGLEDVDGVTALVLELVDGPTLADRIAGRAMPLDEALPIARQVAEALAAAHEQGVIHRDLKPANIKVRPDGTVKVLDFGLAKAVEPASDAGRVGDLSHSPTITSPALMTGVGVLLGTAAYMAPEQARGRPATRRSDIWALGCVLFEMLTGERAFAGDDVSETLAGVLKTEPAWSVLSRHSVPPTLHRLLRRALAKDPARRLDSAAAIVLELEDALAPAGSSIAETNTPPPWKVPMVLAATAAIVLIGTTVLVLSRTPPSREQSAPVRFTVTPRDEDHLPLPQGRLAASPDGRRIVFAVQNGLTVRLVVRQLDLGTITDLRGTEGVYGTPFWSPDNKWLAFFAGGTLKRLEFETGQVVPICDLPVSYGTNATGNIAAAAATGTWARNGTILFAVGSAQVGLNQPLFQVQASGGQPAPATTLDSARGETEHAFPDFLPDDRHFIYLVRRKGLPPAVHIGELGRSGSTALLERVTRALFANPSHLIFVRDGTLYRQTFDADRRELTQDPIAITSDIAVTGGSFRGAFTVSADGLIAFENGRSFELRQFAWFDALGRPLGTAGEPAAYLENFAVTSDGERVLVPREGDLWVLDTRRGTILRATNHPGVENDPVWARDGRAFLFASNRTPPNKLFRKTFGESAPEELVLGDDAVGYFAEDWSADGRFVAVMHGPGGLTHLGVYDTADKKMIPVTSGPYKPDEGHFSPDERFLAYNSDESGRNEIYIEPFPPTGKKWVISTSGGVQPRWRRDGAALFYLSPTGSMMTVPLERRSAAPMGPATKLFETGISLVRDNNDQYDLTADGRFLVLRPFGTPDRGMLTVIAHAIPAEPARYWWDIWGE
jgi:serine/threonine protein kinase